jgi:N-acetyl sugar amidotransferase
MEGLQMSENEYQICARCIMDTSDPNISFDENGMCNHCRRYDQIISRHGSCGQTALTQRLNSLVKQIKMKRGRKEYDCIIGISGGVDSSYAAFIARQQGLRLLGVHVDTGWNSETSVSNIENLVKKLGIDLFTHVVDWDEMRDLQLSFFKSSVANCDIPQDHVIFAALYRIAIKKNIPYVITGSNYATESILPTAWGYDAMDSKHIVSIQKIFGTMKLRKYVLLTFLKRSRIDYLNRLHIITILNYVPYNRSDAIEILKKEIGWNDYGGKHRESRFTRFFQGYYLPKKFGYDKRRAHLSSMIVSGQITRDEALSKMQEKIDYEQVYGEDKEFVAKKLGLTSDTFDKIISLPEKTFLDYPSNYQLYQHLRKLKAIAQRWLS